MYDGWRILFKISQAAYICHYPVIFWYYASTHSNGFMINRWFLMRCSFGAYVLSFVVGILYYLTLDKPIRNLDRLVLFPSKISDSFLIKKTNRQVKKGRKPALKSKKTIVQNTRSTDKIGEGPSTTVEKDAQQEGEGD
jgi:peptidoglycan/LPS O-acetylase OafA/YrhL